MTAQIGADDHDLFGDPRPELLTDVARVQPEPGGEWVDLEKRRGLSARLNGCRSATAPRGRRGGGDVAD